jgi:hypothetical protein
LPWTLEIRLQLCITVTEAKCKSGIKLVNDQEQI